MGIRSSLRNAKYELRYALYGAGGPLLQRLYNGGFNTMDNGTLDSLLGNNSKLPDIAAASGAILTLYKSGKAIDGRWPKLLRGSIQTLACAGLLAATFKAGAYMDEQASTQSIDYIATSVDNLKATASCFSNGEMAPLLYTILYGGLVTGATRWAKNIGSSVIQTFAGKPGPAEDTNEKRKK